jgi:hypothetical protein
MYMTTLKKYMTNRNELKKTEVKIQALMQAVLFMRSEKEKGKSRYTVAKDHF